MDDKEWAAGIEMALNSTLAHNTVFLPGAWAMLQNLARHLPVDIAIGAMGGNPDFRGTETLVSVRPRGTA